MAAHNLVELAIAKRCKGLLRYYKFAILITFLSLLCFGCSTVSTVSFLRTNLANNETEWFSKKPFPYRMNIPYGDWTFQTRENQMVIFSSKSVRGKQIDFIINYIDSVPYYEKDDSDKTILMKNLKSEKGHARVNEGSFQVIAENIDGPVPTNLLTGADFGNFEFFSLYMIKGEYILALTVQDIKGSTNVKQTVLDIYKSLKFISVGEFETEDKKCTNCNYRF
jgi:hypothetical protein